MRLIIVIIVIFSLSCSSDYPSEILEKGLKYQFDIAKNEITKKYQNCLPDSLIYILDDDPIEYFTTKEDDGIVMIYFFSQGIETMGGIGSCREFNGIGFEGRTVSKVSIGDGTILNYSLE